MLDPDIRALQEAEDKLLAGDEACLKYEQYKKNTMDWNSSLAEAEAKGRAEEAAGIVCTMLSLGVPVQEIHLYTGRSISEIEALQEELPPLADKASADGIL